MKKDEIKPYKLIVIPDLQVPFHDKRAMAVVEKYMADETWDEWLQLGDLLDLDQFSRFNRDSPRKIEGRRLKKDFDIANEILDRHQQIVRKNNPKAKFGLILGNHEMRCEKFVDQFPQLEEIVDIERDLRVKERGMKVIRSYPKGEVHRIGKVMFHHGLYTGPNHAKKMVENFGGNIFYGHMNDINLFCKPMWGNDNTLIGQSLGCLCRRDLDYIGANPKNWQLSFGVFYFLPNGDFTHYVPRITGYRFTAPNGKIYSA